MNKSINSPFRYAGGKFYARKLILAHIPKHSIYIEPFAGGGSIFFAKPKVSLNQLNDIDAELINVYKTIRDMPNELATFLKKRSENESHIPDRFSANLLLGEPLPATKELHSFFKNEFKPRNDLEKAGRWFYLNRTSYSGIMNNQNMYWGYGDKYSMQPKNWEQNILRTSLKLQDVHLTSLDFEEVIDSAPNNSLLFIDPPYFNADQDKFYQYSFSKQDHFRLMNCLKRNNIRLKLFITYDNTPEIKEMYRWINEVHDKEWNYCIQRTDDQKNGSDKKGERYKGKELFLLNYDSTSQTQPLNLFSNMV
ncbi:MAG: Dam family site-specific DNA-(adenine-N6)-methyltransferase [Microscillaceae bacterium]|jgi:DNA adenine methylase|nr:Dam family site-specific DNA-(adenine-N6)-methyltransferase [Microscillaceae bacterium]